jgi:DNA-binding MarR family transcriptional regulator
MTKEKTREIDADSDQYQADIALISEAMGRMRVMVGRRIIGRLAIDKIAPELELSHLDVLDAVFRCKGEATVGTIAEIMRIDPSRGSRLVSELVERGMLCRVASQADARRTVVELTEAARRFQKEKLAFKLALIDNFVSDWPKADIAQFAALFSRFVGGFENHARSQIQLDQLGRG